MEKSFYFCTPFRKEMGGWKDAKPFFNMLPV